MQLDSDDELFMPYDMLNDTPEVKFKKSLYLQDIITGLSGNSGSGNATDASKTADLFEQTIADAEQIIMCADEVWNLSTKRSVEMLIYACKFHNDSRLRI